MTVNFLSLDALRAYIKLHFSGDFAIEKQFPVNLISEEKIYTNQLVFHEFVSNFSFSNKFVFAVSDPY